MAFHLSHVPPPASAAGPADDGGLWECGRCGFVNKTATDRSCKGCGAAPPPTALGNGNPPAPAASQMPALPSRPTYVPQQAAYPAQQPPAAPYAASSVSAPTPAAAAPAPFKIPVPAAARPSSSVYSSAPPGASPYAPSAAVAAPSAPPYEPAGQTTTPYAPAPPGASAYVPGAAPSAHAAVPAAYAPPAAAAPAAPYAPYASAPPGAPPYVSGAAPAAPSYAPAAAAYPPPAAAPAASSYAPMPSQPHQQSHQQSQQTFRVPVPPGTQPGQKIGVDTGGAAPVLVTVPQRAEWGGSGAQRFFHVQLPRPATAAAPVVVQGSSVQGSSAHQNNGTMGGIVGSITAAAQNNNGGLVGSITSAATAAAAAAGIATPAAHSSSGVALPAAGGGGAHTMAAPISPRNVTSTPTKLILKEKVMSFTGDDASVKDDSGNTLFKIKADMMTMSQRRKMYDASGQVIGQLRLKKSAFMQPTVYVGTPSDEKKCHVKMTGMLNPLKCNANIYVGETKVGRVSGNYKAKQFEINSVDGKTLATVSKKLTASSYFMDADSYCIYCYPGVDLAFMALVVVSLDELYNDDD